MTHQECHNLLQSALELHSKGEVVLAEEAYLNVLKVDPKNPDAHNLLGVLYHQVGQLPDAIEYISKAIDLRPDLAPYHNSLGNVYYANTSYSKAIESFQHALSLQPDYALAHFNMGNALGQLGQIEEAITSYLKAVESDTKYSDAFKNLSLAQMRVHEYGKAEFSLQKALKLSPNDFELLNNMANIHIKQGQFEKAHLVFEDARKINNHNPVLCFNEALCDFYTKPISDWGSTISSYKHRADPYPTFDYEMNVRQAMHECAVNEYASLGATLNLCEESYTALEQVEDRNSMNMRAYQSYLSELLKYEEVSAIKKGTPAIVMGDSHCLSYASMGLDDIELIVGAKAWHMAQAAGNCYKSSFNAAVGRLKPNATCFLSFGEIDCRAGEGFIKHFKKTGEGLQDNIKATVAEYVKSTAQELEGKGVRSAFLTVPAPYVDLLKLSPEDEALLVETVAYFNKCLVAEASSLGARVIDLYSITNSSAGRADGTNHIDAYHLKPTSQLAKLFEEALT